MFLTVNDFLKDNALWLALGAASLIIIVLAAIFLTGVRKKKKVTYDEVFGKLIDALGGIGNIADASARGSRLTVVLQDKLAMDEEKVKELGVSSLIKMSTKVILVIGNEAAEIVGYIKKNKRT